MAATGKKEYTIKINGIDVSIKEATTLETVLNSLSTTIVKVNEANANTTRISRERSRSISDEEKAEQKLINTIDKVVNVRSDANRAQIEANIAAREAQREVTREIQIRQLAEGSIKQMGMQLTNLRNQYEGLSRAQRDDISVGGELLQQIQSLDAEYKTLRESTGNFRDSVGNYEKALSGLGKVSDGIDGVTKSSIGLAQGLLGVTSFMSLFGDQSEENVERTQQLQKIIALLSIAQAVNTNILKEGIVQNKLAVVTDAIRTAQIKAKTAAEAASTKGTVAATIAQRVFNAVASANPFVILALALTAVGTALFAFISGSNSARKAEEQHKKTLDDLTRSIEANNSELNKRTGILRAMGASELTVLSGTLETIRKNENAARAALDNYKLEVDKGRIKQDDEFLKSLQDTYDAQKEALDNAQNDYDNYFRSIETTLRNHGKTELEIRTEQYENDRKLATGNSEQLKLLEQQYQLDIADIRARNSQKVQKQTNNEQENLIKELADYGKSRLQLLDEQYDREYSILEGNAAAQNTLTRRYLDERNKIISNAEEEQRRIKAEQAKKSAEDAVAFAELELSSIELEFEKRINAIGELTERSSTGLELIDVEATRKNLSDTNTVLYEYIEGLQGYLVQLRLSHEQMLSNLQEGTPEYESELQKYARAVEDVNKRIEDSVQQQSDNTKKIATVQVEALQDLFSKIAEDAENASSAVSAVMDTWNMGLQVQIDDMNEQLDALNERYEEAQQQREDAVSNVEEIESRLQAATGGTAEALKVQLQDAMAARAEADREEKRLAKEKEKLEADIAKREKQMRRNDLLSQISQGVANVAQGITAALGMGLPGIFIAGIIGAMGAVQVGIMTRQLTKLADGGEIVGPSHANGGIPIKGTNYEVEGGEFVINKRSYGANAKLINFINDTPRIITAADIVGVVPGSATPIISNEVGQESEDRIIEAINSINIQPVVSVTDINNIGEDVVTVQDLADF